MMRVALGALGWSPDTFWRSTPHELFAAVDGSNMAQGGKDPDEWSDWYRREFGEQV